jgi:hypothetical protein
MAYIGQQPQTGAYQLCDAITTSATATYPLTISGAAVSPVLAQNCIVSLNGVIQAPVSGFTISGSNIVFSDALTTSDVINFILILGNVLNIGTPSNGTVGTAQLASGLIVPTTKGGTGLTTLGTASQALVVNSGATGLEFATVGAQAGQVIQVLSATDSTARSTTSTSFVTASNTMSVTITPSSSANKILIIASGNQNSGGGGIMMTTIYRNGSTNLGESTYGMTGTNTGDVGAYSSFAINYLDSPATTSATTYQVYFKSNNANTVYLNSGSGATTSTAVKGSITCLEIKG